MIVHMKSTQHASSANVLDVQIYDELQYPEPPFWRVTLTLEQHEIDQMNDDFLEPVDHELTDQR